MGDTTSALSGHDEEQLHHVGAGSPQAGVCWDDRHWLRRNGSRVTAQPRGSGSRC